jgi:hypothetical protein
VVGLDLEVGTTTVQHAAIALIQDLQVLDEVADASHPEENETRLQEEETTRAIDHPRDARLPMVATEVAAGTAEVQATNNAERSSDQAANLSLIHI